MMKQAATPISTADDFAKQLREMFGDGQGVVEVRVVRVFEESLPNPGARRAFLAASKMLADHIGGKSRMPCFRCSMMVAKQPGGFVIVSSAKMAMVASLCRTCAHERHAQEIMEQVQDDLYGELVPIEHYHPEGGHA